MYTSRPVQLIAPAERRSVRLARILAAGVAADASLSVDDTEDLRIAVSEMVALLVEGHDDGGDASIEVTFRATEGEVLVEGELAAGSDGAEDPGVDDLVLEILRVVVDEHSFELGAPGRRFRLVKRTRAT